MLLPFIYDRWGKADFFVSTTHKYETAEQKCVFSLICCPKGIRLSVAKWRVFTVVWKNDTSSIYVSATAWCIRPMGVQYFSYSMCSATLCLSCFVCETDQGLKKKKKYILECAALLAIPENAEGDCSFFIYFVFLAFDSVQIYVWQCFTYFNTPPRKFGLWFNLIALLLFLREIK